jgi:hypothetical protein
VAEETNRLTRWLDPQLGELSWDERNQAWTGRVEFAGHTVPLDIDPGLHDPSQEEQLAIIGPARLLFGKLPPAEPELRRLAAEQVAAAVVEQQHETELPAGEFAAGLELTSISLTEGAALHYRSPEFFPGYTVTIYVNPDLSFGGAEVYQPRPRAERGEPPDRGGI